MGKTKLLILGEALGETEVNRGVPFVGQKGRFLRAMLHAVGIDAKRDDIYLTNVFNLQPPGSDSLYRLCGSKVDGIPHMKALFKGGNGFVKAQYAPELTRVWREIEAHQPNLILALGDAPLWLLKAGVNSITKERGAVFHSIHHPEASRTFKVLPTFHPTYINKSWKDRPLWMSDLSQIAREMEFPEVRYPEREIWVNPTIADICEFSERYINPSSALSVDIETGRDMITEIGVAPDPAHALVIPFIRREPGPENTDGNYWPTLTDELWVWGWVRTLLNLSDKTIFGQNFSYDLSWLWGKYGIRIPNYTDDTMLLAHSQQPEMRKSLGLLASIHSREGTWKHMRKESTKKETN